MNQARAALSERRGEQPDAMAVGARAMRMTGQRLRFRAHYGDAHIGGELDNAVETARQLFRRRELLAAAFRQMLITDSIFPQHFGQHATVVLRPARPRHASHITHESDLVLPQERQEMLERVTAVTDCIYVWHWCDERGCHKERLQKATQQIKKQTERERNQQHRDDRHVDADALAAETQVAGQVAEP